MSDVESQAAPEASTEHRPSDRALLADEANRYGVPLAAYADMTVRERGAVRSRWETQLKAEAKRRGLDPDTFVGMTEAEREGARTDHPDPAASRPKLRKARARGGRLVTDDPPEPPAPDSHMYDPSLTEGDIEDVETHSPLDEVPPPEADPQKRDKPTIGEVMPSENEDLVGWKQPRNLRDVYARFTIGDGQHFVRVERIEPKVWQQQPCSGYLGDIREPISEPEFHAWYGGRVYALTVYGPDPRGRRDPTTGMPIIKAKTEPFRYTVPLLPPNLAVPPGTNPTKLGENTMHPFQMGTQPATPADAQMHKSTLDFFTTQLQRVDAEKEALRREGAGPSKDMLNVVSETNKAALEQARMNAESERRAAEQREKTLQEQVAAEREERKRLEAKVDRMMSENQTGRSDPVEGVTKLMAVTNPGRSAEDEVKRLRDSHSEEMNRIRESHRDMMAGQKERYEDEIRRLRDRIDDTEKNWRAKLDEADRRFREREKELKDQIEQNRRDEREVADRRVKETEVRYDDRIKDIREQHNRELRMQEGQHVTRSDTSKSSYEMQILNLKEKVGTLEEQLEDAREEAEKSKDPVQVMAKAKEQAEAMGYEKPDDEPKTGWDRFLATAGMGLGKAFETVDTWLPKALGRGEGAPQPNPRALPAAAAAAAAAAQQQRQQQQQRPAARRATVAWATEGSVPVAGQQPTVPAQPVVQSAPPVQAQPMPMAQPSVDVAPPVAAPPPQQPATPDQQPASAPTNGQASAAPNALYGAIFPDEIIVQFRAEVERAIEAGMTPDVFAARFVGAFSEASAALVQAHRPAQFVDIVKKMPNGMESIITRRDGRRWIEQMWQEIARRHQQPAAQATA